MDSLLLDLPAVRWYSSDDVPRNRNLSLQTTFYFTTFCDVDARLHQKQVPAVLQPILYIGQRIVERLPTRRVSAAARTAAGSPNAAAGIVVPTATTAAYAGTNRSRESRACAATA